MSERTDLVPGVHVEFKTHHDADIRFGTVEVTSVTTLTHEDDEALPVTVDHPLLVIRELGSPAGDHWYLDQIAVVRVIP